MNDFTQTDSQRRLAEAVKSWNSLFQSNEIDGFRSYRGTNDNLTPPSQYRSNEVAGTTLRQKEDSTFRIYFQNVNGL